MVYHLDIDDNVSLSNTNIRFISKDSKNISSDLSEVINLNTSNKIDYDINFENSNTEKIVSPIGINNNEVIFETLTFNKMFVNQFKYPKTINDVMSLEYDDDLNHYNWTIPKNIVASMYFDGYIDKQKINLTLNEEEGSDRSFYETNDKFYYDEKKKKVIAGTNENYLNEEGIVMPWDELDNKGKLFFSIDIKTYQEYNIDFELNLGNKKPLRGKEGEYFFKEINNE